MIDVKRTAYKEFYDMGVANAAMAFDQRETTDKARESYYQNVLDTAREMGARPGSVAWDAADEGFHETWSELYANRKKLKSMRKKHRRATKRRVLGK